MAADSAIAGLITVESQHSVAETMDKLEAAAKDKGLTVFARINHGAGAERAGLDLAPTQLLLFGNPQGGTPMMQSARSAGIDLPLKALAWQDGSGQVHLSYNDPAWIAERHGITERAPIVEKMQGLLRSLAQAATR